MKRTLQLLACTEVLLAASAGSLHAAAFKADSTHSGFSAGLDRLTATQLFRMTYIGVPLIVDGLLMNIEDEHFRSLRHEYMPEFRAHFDDYLQYSPAAVMFALKAAGVQGRSTWGRLLVSDAFTYALMGGMVNALKLTTDIERPDGSNRHSFPSGHTATAFMCATMLNKEYGHISPLIGIGAYNAAAATGLMRMANNKHWLSDVLTGAGIGILSAEVGYWLADLLFKERGSARIEDEAHFDCLDKPSFIGLYLGQNIPLSEYDISEGVEFSTSSGSAAGLEGAYFFNPFIGAGGRFVVSNTHIIVNSVNAEDNSFDAMTFCGGAYFSYPLSPRWRVGGNALCGFAHYPRLELSEEAIPCRNGFCLGTGTSVMFRAKEHYGIRFFLDYSLLPSHSRHSGEWMNMLTIGSAFTIAL